MVKAVKKLLQLEAELGNRKDSRNQLSHDLAFTGF